MPWAPEDFLMGAWIVYWPPKREIGTDRQASKQIKMQMNESGGTKARGAGWMEWPSGRGTHYPTLETSTDRGQVARFAGCPCHIKEVQIP